MGEPKEGGKPVGDGLGSLGAHELGVGWHETRQTEELAVFDRREWAAANPRQSNVENGEIGRPDMPMGR